MSLLSITPVGPHRLRTKSLSNLTPAHCKMPSLDSLENVYKCLNGCGRSYKLLSSLQRHLSLECGVPKKFICFICDKAYTRKESLKYHMSEKHKVMI